MASCKYTIRPKSNPSHGVNRLVYKPNNKISLIVSYPDERNIYITRIFKDRKKNLAIGLQAFYYQVALSYLIFKRNLQMNF